MEAGMALAVRTEEGAVFGADQPERRVEPLAVAGSEVVAMDSAGTAAEELEVGARVEVGKEGEVKAVEESEVGVRGEEA